MDANLMGKKILENGVVRSWYIVCGRGKVGKTTISAGLGLKLADYIVCNKICKQNCDCRNIKCDLNCPCMRGVSAGKKIGELVTHKSNTLFFDQSSENIEFNDNTFHDQDMNTDTKHNQKYPEANIYVDTDGIKFRDEQPGEIPSFCERCMRKVLLVSLDPQDNISETFKIEVKTEPTQIKNNFYVMELNKNNLSHIEESDENNVVILKSLRSLPGVLEALYFSELIKLSNHYDTIIVDTWPSFSALNFLSFPKELNSLLNKIIGMDDVKNLEKMPFYQKVVSAAENIEKNGGFLKKQTECSFVLVCTPEVLSITETNKLSNKLEYVGIDVETLLINQLLEPKVDCENCKAIERKQESALKFIKENKNNQIFLGFEPNGVSGIESLEKFSDKFV